MPRPFDLTVRAENGLRRGRTTGTCAAAAAKSAVLALFGSTVDEVDINLPNTEFFLPVPISRIERLPDRGIRADVIKVAGDDPDATDGATIFCEVVKNDSHEVRLLAASGVGTVTQPGIRVGVGEPAINPVPRQMILAAVREALAMVSAPTDSGLDIAIGCVNGEEIARKTFNPRLGIVGGISILGTTGIVEPMSLAAYQASVEVYIRVGLADAQSVAFLPGNIGLGCAAKLGLEKKRVVHISNFLGFALDTAEKVNVESGAGLQTLWILGHPGKLCKPLDGFWDTHSKVSGMAMGALARFSESRGYSWSAHISPSNTVEAAIQTISEYKESEQFWLELENALAALFSQRMPSIPQVFVRLFDMSGQSLSGRLTP